VDEVIAAYVHVVGGMDVIDGITTREVSGAVHRGPKLQYFWQAPNKVLLIKKREKIGYDGGSGWEVSRKKKVRHLPGGAEIILEMDANPLRYAHLRSLYSDLSLAPRETLNDRPADVLVAPNKIGSTKLYYDAETHLLVKIEETGEVSAYYKNTTEFMDYKQTDGTQFPFRIVHTTTAPGSDKEDFRIGKVVNNVSLKPAIFSKPESSATVFGGKR